jgi:hypothetical protein
MTVIKYIMSTGVCTTSELLAIKRENPKDYDILVVWAREQAANLGVEIEEPKPSV